MMTAVNPTTFMVQLADGREVPFDVISGTWADASAPQAAPMRIVLPNRVLTDGVLSSLTLQPHKSTVGGGVVTPPPVPVPPPIVIPKGDVVGFPGVNPNFIPLSDAAAASGVDPIAEHFPLNASSAYPEVGHPNSLVPTSAQLAAWRASHDVFKRPSTLCPYHRYVTGNFVGTTGQILQWASRKWSLDTQIMRAQAYWESRGLMQNLGDVWVAPSAAVHALTPRYTWIPGGISSYRSKGLYQLSCFPTAVPGVWGEWPGIDPMAYTCTAFNADYHMAQVAAWYHNPGNWVNAMLGAVEEAKDYHAGDLWMSVAARYSFYPWGNAGQRSYATHIQSVLASKAWPQPAF